MDLKALLGQFFDDKGGIRLPAQLTLAGLSEAVFQRELAEQVPDRPVLRQWLYDASPEGVARDFTRHQVNTRIKAVSARLQQVGALGDRVAILAGNSPEYLFAFMGALYAGMTPIPLYDPTEPGHAEHLRAVFDDARPAVVLTDKASAAAVRAYFAPRPAADRPRVLTVDALPDSLAAAWVNPLETEAGKQLAGAQTQPLDFPAFLQYTSGSTRTPAGVLLTNRSILTNVLQIFVALDLQLPPRVVSWLPLHHDMGIILGSFLTIFGLNLELTSPRDFLQRPGRWARQLARQPIDERLAGTYAALPNFALELLASYGAPQEGEELDFSNVDGLIIGSEPVSEAAVASFLGAFGQGALGERGIAETVLRPSYGLAEASLLVSTPRRGAKVTIEHFDRGELAAGRAVPTAAGEGTVALSSNGQGVPEQFLTIVDPDTRAELADGHVGEIWVHGDNLAAGYMNRPEETAATFRNTLGERLAEGSRVAGAPDDDRWMATGDLGAFVDGGLYITGRLKDLIIIAGRNHYPGDIEATVQSASEHARPDSVAAFSVSGEDTEELIILVERADDAAPAGDAAASELIRAAVTARHGLSPAQIVWKGGLEISRTSSGKIARRVAKKRFLEA